MKNCIDSSAFLFFLLGFLFTTSISAETRYVSDQLEVTLRRGPTLSHAILRMLKSGTPVEVLEVDKESGHTRVKTNNGQEGWILTRYLSAEPTARVQLEQLLKSMNQKEDANVSVIEQLKTIRNEHENAKQLISQLESENKKLTEQLSSLKAASANVLNIEADNKKLRDKLADAEERLNILQNESSEIEARKNRDWFITGALVLFGGLILGLILPRFARKRSSRYSDF
ncbi:SH3 domain protein [Nitrosomonas sp. PY1]|uniref:TIGR04211 family SH3 domain-containing protein n=1 Tax=Nitrosomonas sp. PY1 TaxID=1803906 RepID=UPI001FC8A553|nr:TIGR04211 family SH3 domain-containing protein [Nitrosomonas sp. PY1]GKS68028.1 SH3 domain protein [Nitrosomonas sp. PY1]